MGWAGQSWLCMIWNRQDDISRRRWNSRAESRIKELHLSCWKVWRSSMHLKENQRERSSSVRLYKLIPLAGMRQNNKHPCFCPALKNQWQQSNSSRRRKEVNQQTFGQL